MVSVIVPNYNHARYLKQRIDSILQQTYQDFELIILDDSSTDKSREVIEQYRHHPKVVRIEYNERNSGSVFQQWKKGIDLAQGEYVWIAESDDFAEHNLLSVLVQQLEMYPEAGLAYGDAHIVNEHGDQTGERVSDFQYKLKPRDKGSWVHDGLFELQHSLAYWCSINNASAVLFRRIALNKLKFKLTDFFYAGDWATYVSIASSGKIVYADTIVSNFRRHAGNSSRSAYTSGKFFVDEFRIVSFCLRNVFEDKAERKKYYLSKYHILLERPASMLSARQFRRLLAKYFFIDPVLSFKLSIERLLKFRFAFS